MTLPLRKGKGRNKRNITFAQAFARRSGLQLTSNFSVVLVFLQKKKIMDLQARKIEFVHEFLKIQREDIVMRLKTQISLFSILRKNENIKIYICIKT